MYRPFFNPHVQNYVRDGCLTAAPWLWATGLPGDTLGLLTVCRYHQDVCLEKQQLEEASSREETSHLQAERECLSACLEDQEKEIVQLSHAAERATEAATANIHNMRAEAEEATLAHAQEAAGLKQQLADAKRLASLFQDIAALKARSPASYLPNSRAADPPTCSSSA
ncbi:hypothetical protein WJX84_006323 [Apatococcus fuscideae]|uniref:Uncharacterized protein n=1 Tax=Apatococcus fuscideae TaxID=2026836 RepID=A0AAW1SLC3_9CHLO